MDSKTNASFEGVNPASVAIPEFITAIWFYAKVPGIFAAESFKIFKFLGFDLISLKVEN